MKYIINILLAVFLQLNLMAQDVKVNARLDTNILLIGDQTTLHLELIQPKSKKVYLPNIAENKLGKSFDIISISKFDTLTKPNSNQISINFDLVISTFDTGFVSIPPLSFKYNIINDSTYSSANTPELFLRILSLKVDMKKGIADIKPIIEVPVIWQDYILYVIIGLGIIILILIGIYIYRRIKNNKPIFVLPKKPKVPPHITAIKQLDQLSNKKLWQNNEFKEYYSSLTDIIRTYMDGIWNIGAMEMVSDDIIDQLNSQKLSDDLRNQTEEVLKLADFVKFAKTKPLADDNSNALKWAYNFVNETKPKAESENIENTDNKEVKEVKQ